MMSSSPIKDVLWTTRFSGQHDCIDICPCRENLTVKTCGQRSDSRECQLPSWRQWVSGVCQSGGHRVCWVRKLLASILGKATDFIWLFRAIASPQVSSYVRLPFDCCVSYTQVLELSGIGDPEVLRRAGVEMVVDLQGVGNNVQEHFHAGITYRAFISSCLQMSRRCWEHRAEVKEELQSQYLTFDCLNDPDELRKQTEL